uniref:NACHT domain-containing protein n=1 Tax=Amphimedon queenslandica TaxID=400682 RepID=A0A1X7UFE6_AMPQE
MIDVSQWRASIGLWNYCQAASSRPANGYHSHSFKAAVDNKSGSTTSRFKLLAALSLIISLLLSLLRYMKLNFIPPTGKQANSIITVTVMIHCFQSLALFIATTGSSSDLIYYLVLLFLLLLSGDVELNPGPMIDDQPDIFLLLQWLEPLVDWKPFGLLLPEITQHDITIIEQVDTKHQKLALFTKWLNTDPTATWRDVLNALTKREEINLIQTINNLLQVDLHICTGGNNDAPVSSIAPVVSTVLSSVSVINKLVTSITSGNPKDILRTHSYKLGHAISVNLYNVTDALYAKELIPQQTKEAMHVSGVTDNEKSSKIMLIIEQLLESSPNPEQYLIDICHVLINQHCTLTDIAISILHELGQSIPDNVSLDTVLPSPVDDKSKTPVTIVKCQSDVAKPISSIPNDVQGYADSMREYYKSQSIVARSTSDWLPKIGKEFFGKLALVEKQDSSTQAESAWHMLRGLVDKTVKLTENKEISVEDILKPTESSLSLRVVIDGPPGIGKTTLCRKLLNMWSNGTLVHQQYDLVLYCPLREAKIATDTTELADLFVHRYYEVPMVAEWFEKRNGEGLLIIFDGWDELSEQLRQSSLAASIIHRKWLPKCSVIVTSRSYASSSLLKMDTLSRHVQVIGFSEEEISTVIIQALEKDTELAQKIVNDLKVRKAVQSLCYVPLVCSMVILVYHEEGGRLPTTLTLTQLYENFILQTISRHVEIKGRHDIDPHDLGSLSSLPLQLAKPLQEMCQIAYTNLANTTMTFSSHQLPSPSEAVKEDYLGLMTAFIEYREKKYQFLHWSIQDFLAAWWIVKHEKTEKVFKDHFDHDHFQMCLIFVAGLTHLEHESYQQYFFNKQQHDLQCKKKPLFGFDTCYTSFYQNPEVREYDHISFSDFGNVPILLFQLLYESQNKTLCQVLAQSINKHSLCLNSESLSLYDWLCLSYCINNSNIKWDHLHLGCVFNQSLSVFNTGLSPVVKNNSGLTDNSLQTQCKRLELRRWLYDPTDELIHKLLQSSLLYNIQECYCGLKSGQYVPCFVLLQFLNLPQLKILHLIMRQPRSTIPTFDNTYYTCKCTKLETCIEMNLLLQEMKIEYKGEKEISSTIISVIRGVTKNKTIVSLMIHVHVPLAPPSPLQDGVIEQLLKGNNTLQALSLNIDDELIPSSLNIVEVNTPLTALEIGGEKKSSELMTALLLYIQGLHCLILDEPYPPHLLFDSHPSLHTLTLPLDTAESAIELFNILQTKATLKALDVEIKEERVCTRNVDDSLQDMLTQNQALKYIKINDWYSDWYIPIPSSFLSFLTTGLRHNTSLQQLSVSIPLPVNEEIRTFINVISEKKNLVELEVNFKPDQSCNYCCREEGKQIITSFFYEQVLPAVTNMLQSHATIRLLRIKCKDINKKIFQPNWIELVQHLYETIFIHPALEYIGIYTGYPAPRLLKDTLKDQKETLIDRHRKEQPCKPLPIVHM